MNTKMVLKRALLTTGCTAMVLASVGAGWPSQKPKTDQPEQAAVPSAPTTPAPPEAALTPMPAEAAPAIVGKPLGEAYQILLKRSIFARDGRPAVVVYPHKSKSAPLSTQPATTAPAVVVTPDPEAGFVLRGVGMQDGVFTAFFEQTSENKGYSRRAGEAVARGKVLAMSLDGVDFELNGKISHVVIGQALDGKMAPATVATASAGQSGDWHSKWRRSDTPGAPGGPTVATADGGKDRSHSGKHDGEPDKRDDKNRDDNQQPGPEANGRPDMRPSDPGIQPDEVPVIPIIIDPN